MKPSGLDDIRERWAIVRQSIYLWNPLAEDFGEGGLARHATGAHVRFLILPADPRAALAEFDSETWSWWLADWPNPFDGGNRTEWGTESIPVADAAVRFNRGGDDRWQWDTYLALHRSGALEFGLGRIGSLSWQRWEGEDEIRVFFLTRIVGRTWWALSRYSDVVERLQVGGPWEVTLGLRRTSGSVLGNVAAGWEEPQQTFSREPPHCPDPNVLIVREVEEWPQDDAARSLALSLGAAIEDAWGCKQRRYLSRIDPGAGTFDSSRYG